MIYYIMHHFFDAPTLLNVFKYITFRSGCAAITALLISLAYGRSFITFLKKHQHHGQPIRMDGPLSHILDKKGTPTMGGLLILLSLTVSTLLWCRPTNIFVWIVLGTGLGLGGIGLVDDYLKVTRQSSRGMPGNIKFLLQVLVSLTAILFIDYALPNALNRTLFFPFLKQVAIPLGVGLIPFGVLVISGASNAVNLTDGLDGLAIGPSIVVAFCFAILSYVVGHANFSTYLHIPHIPGSGELTVVCGALLGAGLGFLWFNAPPASVFMGDTGSLAIGGMIGAMSLIIKQELVLCIIGGLFVIEAISVIIQVGYFKWTGGKRIFLMAPLHHHFEKKGWAESTVVIRFWIISLVLGMIGLSSLKLR